MRREFSEGALNILLKKYPSLDKETANRILTFSRISINRDESPFGSIILIRNQEYIMRIRHAEDRRYFFGEDDITLFPDEEGVIYRELQ